MTIKVEDKFGELYKTQPVGNPYHGKVENGVLTLPNGATIPWTGVGACVLLKLPFTRPVPTPENDVAAGLRYDDYVLLHGTALSYPTADGSAAPIGWLYEPSENEVWRIELYDWVTTYPYMSTTFSITHCVTGEINIIDVTEFIPPDRDRYVYFHPAPSGTKALFITTQPVTGGGLEVKAIYEVSVSGGGAGVVPTLSFSTVVHPADISVERSGPRYDAGTSTGSYFKHVTLAREKVSWEGVYRMTIHDIGTYSGGTLHECWHSITTTVVGASYDIDDGLCIFEMVFDGAIEGTRITSGYSKDLTYINGPEGITDPTYTYTASTTLINESWGTLSFGIRGRAKVSMTYSTKVTTVRAQLITEHATSPFYGTDEYGPTNEDPSRYPAPIGAPTTVDLGPQETRSGTSSGFPEGATQQDIFSAYMLGIGVAGLMVKSSLVAAVSAHGVTNLCGAPMTYAPGTSPRAVAHPLTGEMVFGPGCGFV